MAMYALRRLLGLVPVLLGVSFLVFLSIRLVPGDPAVVIAGAQATDEDIARVRNRLGLDQPIPVQYVRWMARVIQGDLGTSVRTGYPVLPVLAQRAKMTLLLTTIAVAIATVTGVLLGVHAALRVHSWTDYLTSFLSILGISLPVFWTGLMLMYLLSVQWRLLPTSGAGSPRHLVLPAVTLALNSIAIIARTTRSCVLEVINQDYVATARAKGCAHGRVVYRHVLKNAMIPVATVIGLQFGYLMGGAVVTETVFNWPGLGRLLTDAIFLRDFPVLQGGVLFIATFFVMVNLIADWAVALLDPRVRLY